MKFSHGLAVTAIGGFAVMIGIITLPPVDPRDIPPPGSEAEAYEKAARLPKVQTFSERTMYVQADTLCFRNRDDAQLFAQVARENDKEAAEALIEQRKGVPIKTGTRLEVSSLEYGWHWGRVTSGRLIGQTCYIAASQLVTR